MCHTIPNCHPFFTQFPKDWIFFIDCDAFFTDFSTSLGDLIATHSAAMASQRDMEHAHFLVAEDPGGINTGVFLIRNLDMVGIEYRMFLELGTGRCFCVFL
jgi:hypothetical protein